MRAGRKRCDDVAGDGGLGRFMVRGEPHGSRGGRLVVYDVHGVIADRGPVFLDVHAGTQGDVAPLTTLTATPTGPFAAELRATSNAPAAVFSFRVSETGGAGPAPSWTLPDPAGVLALGGLGAGTYHVQARSSHSANAAAELVTDAAGDELALRVAGDGTVTVRR